MKSTQRKVEQQRDSKEEVHSVEPGRFTVCRGRPVRELKWQHRLEVHLLTSFSREVSLFFS